MNVLEQIISERRADAATARANISPDALQAQARGRVHHSLKQRLEQHTGTCIIAEMKRASPSAGLLRPDYRPVDIGRDYTAQGAAGLSILTEPRHFQGSEEHLRAVRAAVDLPILRKDFIVDPYQILESAAWGADVVLLIVAALGDGDLRGLHEEAMALGLEVLVEAHTGAEVARALALPGAMIGVNSRNLKTLKTDLAVARSLASAIPAGRLAIAESGIATRAEILDLEQRGYRGFLIGESLLATPEPGRKLRALLGEG